MKEIYLLTLMVFYFLTIIIGTTFLIVKYDWSAWNYLLGMFLMSPITIRVKTKKS